MIAGSPNLELSASVSETLRVKPSSVLAVLTALSDRGYYVLPEEELAAALADLNQLIDIHVPARTGRESHAYVRSQELVALLDERLNVS